MCFALYGGSDSLQYPCHVSCCKWIKADHLYSFHKLYGHIVFSGKAEGPPDILMQKEFVMVAMRDEEVLYSVYIQYSVYSNQNDMSFCYEICVWGDIQCP